MITFYKYCANFSSKYLGKSYSNQISLNFKNTDDNLLLRVESSMTNYNFNGDDIIAIQLLVYKVEYTDTVNKSLDLSLSNLGYNKDLLDLGKTKFDLVFNKILPKTMDVNKFGNELEIDVKNNEIKSVLVDNKWLDLSNMIQKNNFKETDKNIVLSEDTKIFSDSNNKYLIAIKSPKQTLDTHYINVFTVDGKHVLNVIDSSVSKTVFTRTIGNVSKTIDLKNSIVSSKIIVKLEAIKQPKSLYLFKNLK